MRETELPVTFQPAGRTVFVLSGTRVMEAAVTAGLIVDLPCGGEGICGKCRVHMLAGAERPTLAEERFFSAKELEDGWRLACQSKIASPSRIEIPGVSLLSAGRHQIFTGTESAATASSDDPPLRKRYVELPPPSRGSDEPDLLRLENAIGPYEADLSLTRELPSLLRTQKFRGTAVIADHHRQNESSSVSSLLDFEPDNTENASFAISFDIGTTTLAAQLLNLSDGTEIGIASRLNPQTRFGDDVLSRILLTREKSAGLGDLQKAIVDAVNEMIGELCANAGVHNHRIYEIGFAGNTTMQHLLCRLDPRSLGEVPFVPAVARGQLVAASELGLKIHPRGRAYVFPVIGGFVGGDTVAGILATGMTESESPTLLVDIGTNGEIVLWANGKLTAASTAAGPAFEGARISCGMRGCDGAIEKIVANEHLRINVIGNVAPVGLCGSGLIDAAAELLRQGLLDQRGKLLDRKSYRDELSARGIRLPSPLQEDFCYRLVSHDGQNAFQLAAAEESGSGRALLLTQRDFRELQLAAGAIRAGVAILLRRAGLQPDDLREVFVAGGFGNFIRRNNAQRIGLLPHEIEHRRIRYRGNTSLAGARMAALSLQARRQAEELARRTEHVDLSLDPAFQDAFADAMIFPEA